MEDKINPNQTMIANKEEDEKKKIKKTVVIGQKTGEEISKGKETMKIEDGLRQNQDVTRQDVSKKDSRSSSASLEKIMANFDNDKNSSQNDVESTKKEEENKKKTSSHVWDCGSSLYDSFELNSFKRQLNSAISASSARTMSMSHLPDRCLPSTSPATSSTSSAGKKHSNKISRSLQRFLKSVFRPKQHQSSSSSVPSSPVYKAAGHSGDIDRYYVVYDKSGSLTTIPESTEKEVGPEINSLVRKTVSERFPASRVVGISCA